MQMTLLRGKTPDHVIKAHPYPFQAVWEGRKTYEIRVDDRGYKVGDWVLMREWDPIGELYSGLAVEFQISYKTSGGEWGIPEGLCVLGFRDATRRTASKAEWRMKQIVCY